MSTTNICNGKPLLVPKPDLPESAFEQHGFITGQRISIDGYLYNVERVAGLFFVVKFIGVDKEEDRPQEHRFRLKKGSLFRIDRNEYKVMASTGGVWLRCKYIGRQK